jgi:branched-chain amino acid transport system substrate-binding protein
MRKYRLLLSVLLLLLAGMPQSGLGQPPLKVGALIPYTGRWGDSGRECARGMLDAGRWINQQGGVFGRKLEILLINDTPHIAETVAAYRKLNEGDHILIFYVYSTETALTLLSHIQFGRIPTFVSFLPSHLADPSKHPFIFTITPTPLDLSKIAMTFISERSGIKARKPKILFLGSSDYLDRHFLEEAKVYAYQLGLEIAPDTLFTHFTQVEEPTSADRSSMNLSVLLSTIQRYNPDFTYLSLTSKEAFLILQEARRQAVKTNWVANMKAFDETLAPFDGVFGVQPLAPFGENIPGMAEIMEAHQKWHPYDSHTLSYTEGWATIHIMAEALGRSLPEEGLSRERVKDSIETLRNYVLGGLIPPITITRNDHRPSMESRILTIKNSKLLPYTPFISIGRDGKRLQE